MSMEEGKKEGNSWPIMSDKKTKVRLDKVWFGDTMSYNRKINVLLDVYDKLTLVAKQSGVTIPVVVGMVESICSVLPERIEKEVDPVGYYDRRHSSDVSVKSENSISDEEEMVHVDPSVDDVEENHIYVEDTGQEDDGQQQQQPQ